MADPILPGGANTPDEKSGDRHPVISRARAKVNKPEPKTKSFGTGDASFVKVPGRSPGAPPPLVDSGRRTGVGDLPEEPVASELGKLLAKKQTRLERLAKRLRGLSPLEKALAASALAGLLFLLYVARHR